MHTDDEKMIFDEYENRYKLTEEALLANGIDIRARYTEAGIGDAGLAITALISDATNIVYNYAHDGVYDNCKQDFILNNDEIVRKGVYRALLAMAKSLARYGNRLNSVEGGERGVAIPVEVKAEFEIVYPHLGHTLKYAGRW